MDSHICLLCERVIVIMPEFELNGAMIKACGWVGDVLSRVRIYLDLKDEFGNLFVQRILVPMIHSVLRAADQPCSDADLHTYHETIMKRALDMFEGTSVIVKFDGCDPTAFAQASADGSKIYINPAWAAAADGLRTSCNQSNFNKELYDLQIAIGVIKIIHELACCFTPMILKLEYELQKLRKLPDPSAMDVIPITVGYKYGFIGEKQSALGDMGFEAERLLTAAGRVYCSSDPPWIFYKIIVYVLGESNGKGKSKMLLTPHHIRHQAAWASKIARSTEPKIEDFRVDLLMPKQNQTLLRARVGTEVDSGCKRKRFKLQPKHDLHDHHSEDDDEQEREGSEGSADDEDTDEGEQWAVHGLVEEIYPGRKT